MRCDVVSVCGASPPLASPTTSTTATVAGFDDEAVLVAALLARTPAAGRSSTPPPPTSAPPGARESAPSPVSSACGSGSSRAGSVGSRDDLHVLHEPGAIVCGSIVPAFVSRNPSSATATTAVHASPASSWWPSPSGRVRTRATSPVSFAPSDVSEGRERSDSAVEDVRERQSECNAAVQQPPAPVGPAPAYTESVTEASPSPASSATTDADALAAAASVSLSPPPAILTDSMTLALMRVDPDLSPPEYTPSSLDDFAIREEHCVVVSPAVPNASSSPIALSRSSIARSTSFSLGNGSASIHSVASSGGTWRVAGRRSWAFLNASGVRGSDGEDVGTRAWRRPRSTTAAPAMSGMGVRNAGPNRGAIRAVASMPDLGEEAGRRVGVVEREEVTRVTDE
ncbi:hypothetical protein HK101_006765, partial [Irineochytrium annulatum]